MAISNSTRKRLLTESSTSDGGTLYLVMQPINGSVATLDDILVEIQNEMHLFHIVMGTTSSAELNAMRLFINKAAAQKLAEHRLSGGDQTTF